MKNSNFTDAQIIEDESFDSHLSDEQSDDLDEKQALEVFGSEQNAKSSVSILKDTFKSYVNKPKEMDLKTWVENELNRYPETFTKDEALKTSSEIIESSININQTATNLDKELKNGGSKESFIAKSIQEGASALNIANIGNYANEVQSSLAKANEINLETYLTKDGIVNQNKNLHGFIAEEHHVNTFNIDATTKNSSLRAEMNQSINKNSVDITIKDLKTGKVVKRYQAKYGQDAKSTEKYFQDENGNYKYKGQGKLVPKGQEGEIKNSTSTIEAGDVKSKPLSYKDAQKAKEQAQKEQQIKDYDWDRVNKLDMSKHIAKQAGFAAVINSGMQGGYILGRRVFNFLSGKENQPLSEDLKEWLNATYEGGKNVAITTVATTGLTIIVRKGLVGALAKATPIGQLANIAYVGVCNVKLLYKMAIGELSSKKGFDEMRKATVSTAASLSGAFYGAAFGTVLGPVGSILGGTIGAVVGGIVGSTAGELINKAYKKTKQIAKDAIKISFECAKDLVCSTTNAIKNVVCGVGSAISSGIKSVGSAVCSFFGF